MNSSGVVLETGSGSASATPDMAGCVRQRLVEGGNDAAQPLHRGGVGRVRVEHRAADRPGVTTIISSLTASNTTMMVGRTKTLSGTPSASGRSLGRCSISRTVS